ncbi:phospholipase A1-like [Arctopsyche grandis]|uniref:phospholipase A1-like n=1 Tax=Arctopsyche grandis TaxID=121162 RepID=UPI00406D87E8
MFALKQTVLISAFMLIILKSCSSDDILEKLMVNSDDTITFMDAWENLHNVDSKAPEPVKCSRIGRAASKLKWLLDFSSERNSTVDFFLSTRKNRTAALITNEALDRKIIKHFHPKKTTYVIVHGWLSNASASWVVDMKEALLDWDDANVISVDWSSGGSTLKYWKAVKNIETVGNNIATMLQRLMQITGMPKKSFHLIGHSLGAHISSYAAVKMGTVRRITGLDPAHTCAITSNNEYLLDKTDADFVDVIHTSATLLVKFGFGTRSAIGHVDFYPNGGEKQPECYERKRNPLSRFIPFYRKATEGVCNHGRAYDLFTESLKKTDCHYIGHAWNRTTESVQPSIDAPCTIQTCTLMGIYADRSIARGSFYVPTKTEKSYCDRFNDILKGIVPKYKSRPTSG